MIPPVAGLPSSSLSPTAANSLPQIDSSALPPDVRRGTREQQNTYKAALGFERMLVRQLIDSMTQSADALGGEDEEGSSATTSTYKQLFADSLADNVARGGGLGMARSMYDALQGAAK